MTMASSSKIVFERDLKNLIIYISFDEADGRFAQELIANLRKSEYVICASQGEPNESLRLCILFVAIVSLAYGLDGSVTSTELKYALNARKRIIPINLPSNGQWPPHSIEIQLPSIQCLQVDSPIDAYVTSKQLLKYVFPKKAQPAKELMISYATADGATYARRLKEGLAMHGITSVYLDKDEIKPGDDWQNELRDAVKGCDFFVPLVTPIYGTTQWTELEAKFAINLKKQIIPINFREKWPPSEFEIQFNDLKFIKTLGIKDPIASVAYKIFKKIELEYLNRNFSFDF